MATKCLDHRTREFLDALSPRPASSEEPRALRARARELEGAPACLLPRVSMERVSAGIGGGASVLLTIVRPEPTSERLPVVMYLHGGGWLFGDEHTHAWPVAQLAASLPAAVVFGQYSLAPEARYPVALEESYRALEWTAGHGDRFALGVGRPERRALDFCGQVTVSAEGLPGA